MRVRIRHVSLTFEGEAFSRERAVGIARRALGGVSRVPQAPVPGKPIERLEVRMPWRASTDDNTNADRIAGAVQDRLALQKPRGY